MKNSALQLLDIARIKELFPEAEKFSLGDDLILGGLSGSVLLKSEMLLKALARPVRFDGYIIMFVRKGKLNVEVNVETYEMRPNSLIFNLPSNVIALHTMEEGFADVELFFTFISSEFMGISRFDFNKVLQDSIRVLSTPCVTLREKDLSIANDYYFLAKKMLRMKCSNKREILGSLLTSFAYYALEIWSRKIEVENDVRKSVSARTNQAFERFINLVSEHHNSQRAVGFYAQKLSLTPKYLSKLVREASGRSAPEWIDSFVVMEARNLLRYSDMSIKEIVYALNFPNQSVFYRYFKEHTGMTPLQYRKS